MQGANLESGIIIIGLGRLQPGQLRLSNRAAAYFQANYPVYLKTSDPRLLDHISSEYDLVVPEISELDGRADNYGGLIETLLANSPVIYAVPGDPMIDEASTPLIQAAAEEAGIPVTIIENEANLTWILRELRISPGSGLQIVDATLLCGYHYPPLEPDRSVLIVGLFQPNLIASLKKVLMNIYRSNTVTTVISENGVEEVSLGHLSAGVTDLFIPAQTDKVGLTRFQETIAHLRAPDGCPWDKKQTHQSLRPFLLEETYEVLQALDEGNLTDLADELGDVLLQIILHAQIGSEAQTFQMGDIIGHIQRKMVRRHPHVFGDIEVDGVAAVHRNWDRIKAEEKAEKGVVAGPTSAMDGIPPTLPALMQALEVSKKAVKQGFEWADAAGVLTKLQEEAEEIATAQSPHEVEAEIGDFLFTAVNLARKLGVDAETALRACNHRFMRRFRQLETLAQAENLHLPDLDEQTWFDLWQQAKRDVAHLETK